MTNHIDHDLDQRGRSPDDDCEAGDGHRRPSAPDECEDEKET
jgi:hypothetical protein